MQISNKRWRVVILLAILALAFFLRFQGIDYRTYRDETMQVYMALRIGRLDFREVHSGVWPFILFGFYGLVYLGGLIAGRFSSPDNILALYFLRPHIIYWLARFLEVLAGTGAVYLLYLLGKKMWDREAGLIAALLLAVSRVDVFVSQVARGQAFTVLFMIAAFYYIWQVAVRGRKSDYFLAALFIIFAVQIRVMAFNLLLPFLLAHFRQIHYQRARLRKGFARPRFILSFLLIPLGFYFLNPANWYRGYSRLVSLRNIFGFIIGARREGAIDAVIHARYANAFNYYIQSGLPWMYGGILLVVVIVGLIFAFARLKDFRNPLILSAAVPYFLVASTASIALRYYLFPISFMLLLLAAVFLNSGFDFAIRKLKIHSSLKAAIIILLVIHPAVLVIGANRAKVSPDTRVISRDWIRSNLASGTRIVVESPANMGPDLQDFPVLEPWMYNLSRAQLDELYRERMESDPGGSYALRFFIENPPDPKYFIIPIGAREDVDIESLKEKNAEYVVIAVSVRDGWKRDYIRENFPERYAARAGFYSWVENEGELIGTFSAGNGMVGPTIEIYRMEN